MKKSIVTMLLFFTIQIIQAQSHQMGEGYNCKLKKVKSGTEGYSCQACVAIEKKEQNVKIEAEKRRTAEAKAKIALEKEKLERERLKKIAEAKKNSESGKVYVNNSNQPAVTPGKTTDGITILISKKDYSKTKLFGIENNTEEGFISFILSEAGDTIMSSTKMYAPMWNEDVKKEDIPNGVIIVQYKKVEVRGKYDRLVHYGRYSLLNSKGEELLEEKKINSLAYLGNNFFAYTIVNENEDIYSVYGNQYGNRGCGSTMVIYDFKLNKKHYFKSSNGKNACFIPYYGLKLENGNLLGFIHVRDGLYFYGRGDSGIKDKYIINAKREIIKVDN